MMWILAEEHSARALQLRDGWFRDDIPLIAPALFKAEVTSVLREQVHRRGLLLEEAEQALDVALSWPIQIVEPTDELQRKAFDLATRFNRPKAYDAQYLAVARLASCELWTGDERLVNAVAGKLPWLKFVGHQQAV